MPVVFSLPNIGNKYEIVMLMIPYLLATSFFGLAASVFYTDSETPLLMIAFFSVGLIFLSGVSYPLELMPWYWKASHFIFPAAPGTLAFVKINSMGATIADSVTFEARGVEGMENLRRQVHAKACDSCAPRG